MFWGDTAHNLGVTIIYSDPGKGHDGVYYDHLKLIIIKPTLTPLWEKWVIWHELGHAWHRHKESTKLSERQADIFAVTRLITLDEYRRVEYLYPDMNQMSQELLVPPHAIKIYQSLLPKLIANNHKGTSDCRSYAYKTETTQMGTRST